MAGLEFSTDYLNDYLQMVEDTESPRIFHVWSALWAVSTALGRRCKINSGLIEVLPNQYVLMVGTPGTRKSTAMGIARRLLKDSTGTRFAPSDTGFQRQGLALALQGTESNANEILNQAVMAANNDTISSLTQLNEVTDLSNVDESEHDFIDEADKHHIAICAGEFSRVIGQNNHSMLDFLGERYDGDEYTYQTRQSYIKMKHTLINMLSCTTPASVAHALPPQAGGQGFLSRIILVYGARKYKEIPWPEAPDALLVGRVKEVLSEIYYKMSGTFELTRAAKDASTELYHHVSEISDTRFAHYIDRRFAHLNKVTMAIAASRGSMTIQPEDYEEAHRILRATEQGMPDALGEFGMNPLAQLKQEILEQLRAQQGPLLMEQIVAMFHRDARSSEIMEVVNDLLKAKQVTLSQLPSGQRVLTAKFKLGNTEDSMMTLLAERS